MLEAWIATFLADALVAAGDIAGAEAVVARSAAVQVRSAFARYEFVQGRAVHAALVAGDPVLARRRLEPVLAVLGGCGIPFVLVEAALLSGRLAVQEGDAAAGAAAARAAAELAATFGTPWYAAAVDDLAGRAAAAAGDAGAAEDAHQRALAVCARHSFKAAGADALERIASLAAQGGSVAEAARLLGAAAGLRKRSGAVRAPADQPAYDADLTRLQAVLGAQAWADLWAQGRCTRPRRSRRLRAACPRRAQTPVDRLGRTHPDGAGRRRPRRRGHVERGDRGADVHHDRDREVPPAPRVHQAPSGQPDPTRSRRPGQEGRTEQVSPAGSPGRTCI